MGFDGWFSKGGSTQNRRILMDDFSKGGVHKTDGFDGWCFKGGSTQNQWVLMDDVSKGGVHKTDEFVECFFSFLKIKRPGRLFRQIRYFLAWTFHPTAMLHTVLRRILYGVCLPLHWTSTIPSNSGSCSRTSKTRWNFWLKSKKMMKIFHENIEMIKIVGINSFKEGFLISFSLKRCCIWDFRDSARLRKTYTKEKFSLRNSDLFRWLGQ